MITRNRLANEAYCLFISHGVSVATAYEWSQDMANFIVDKHPEILTLKSR